MDRPIGRFPLSDNPIPFSQPFDSNNIITVEFIPHASPFDGSTLFPIQELEIIRKHSNCSNEKKVVRNEKCNTVRKFKLLYPQALRKINAKTYSIQSNSPSGYLTFSIVRQLYILFKNYLEINIESDWLVKKN